MKTYNAIRADFDGTVTAICATSGDSVGDSIIEHYSKRLRIKAASPEIEAGSLSGGNQQKVVPVSYTHLDVYKRQVLIDRVIKNKITIPVILCSSVNLKYPEIYGCVYYSRERKMCIRDRFFKGALISR